MRLGMARPKGKNVRRVVLWIGSIELEDAHRRATPRTTLSRYVTEALRRYNATRRHHRPPPAQGTPQAAPRAA